MTSRLPSHIDTSRQPVLIIASSNSEKSRELKNYMEDILRGTALATTLFDKTIVRDENKLAEIFLQLSQYNASSPQDLAVKKAQYVADQFSTLAVAEETLLVIPSLGNEEKAFHNKIHDTLLTHAEENTPSSCHHSLPFPFLRTRRLPDIQKILLQLSPHEDVISRSAYLLSFLAFACPHNGPYGSVCSRLEGYIHDREAGPSSYEFGSIFIKHEYPKTLSELAQTGSVYSRISHRRKAVEKLRPMLMQALLKHPTGIHL